MYKKKMTILAMAACLAASLPLLAEEGVAAQAETATASEAVSQDNAAASAPSVEDRMAAMEARLREREARYEALKARASEAGVMLPEDPPWRSAGPGMMRPDMAERMPQHQAMMAMTPEERQQIREEHFKQMQTMAEERGMAMPQRPSWSSPQAADDEAWAKHMAVIEGMTDEQRAACHAMHQRHMGQMMMRDRPMMRGPGMGSGMMQPGMTQPGMGPGMMQPGMGPGMMQPGMGPGMMQPGRGQGMPGSGYGYGPEPYGQQNFWNPNQ